MGRTGNSEPRRHQLNLSLTASELERIRSRAEAVGMRPVHFGRALILDETRSPSRRTTKQFTSATPLDTLIYSQLARLGNNLNQMVRHLHRTGEPLPADLEPLLQDIRQTLARITA